MVCDGDPGCPGKSRSPVEAEDASSKLAEKGTVTSTWLRRAVRATSSRAADGFAARHRSIWSG